MKIDRATFPNYDETTQVRAYELKGDTLSWKVPARPDGSIPITVLRRIAVQGNRTKRGRSRVPSLAFSP
jgi:hypothetical protein